MSKLKANSYTAFILYKTYTFWPASINIFAQECANLIQEFYMKKLAIVLLALVTVPVMAKDRASRFDKDGDNRVSYVELTEKCEVRKSLFDKADKDSDGVLTNGEMKTAKEYLFKNRCDRVEDKNA